MPSMLLTLFLDLMGFDVQWDDEYFYGPKSFNGTRPVQDRISVELNVTCHILSFNLNYL